MYSMTSFGISYFLAILFIILGQNALLLTDLKVKRY